MCEPVTLTALGTAAMGAMSSATAAVGGAGGLAAIASTGLGIASAVGQYQQQQAGAKAQTQAYYQNQENAARAFEMEKRSILERQMQEQEQTAAKKANQVREYETAVASATNKASEAGVAGLSLQALMGDLATQQANRQGQTDDNLTAVMNQLQTESRGQSTNMMNRINSLKTGGKPSSSGLALQIGGSVISGYDKYKKGAA